MSDLSDLSGRRGLVVAVASVAVGAGLVLLGASRVWWVQTVPQPAPLRPEEIVHTGTTLAPVLPALGFVALAGAGGLLATRSTARRLVGGLLAAAAAGAFALVLVVLGDPVGLRWPMACLIGAVLVAAAGVLTVRDGHRWPVMGRRYGRGAPDAAPIPRSADLPPPAPAAPVVGDRPPRPAESAEWWDALDRGEDPTRG